MEIEFIKTSEFWMGFLGGNGVGGILTYWVKKIIDKKYESKNHEKGYQNALEQKKNIVSNVIKMIDEFKFRKKNLGLIDDENGVPIAEETIENIYVEYFIKIFEKLKHDKLYLSEKTLKNIEVLETDYSDYSDIKNKIMGEYHDNEKSQAIKKINEDFLDKTSFKFNTLIESITYNERRDIQEKLGL